MFFFLRSFNLGGSADIDLFPSPTKVGSLELMEGVATMEVRPRWMEGGMMEAKVGGWMVDFFWGLSYTHEDWFFEPQEWRWMEDHVPF